MGACCSAPAVAQQHHHDRQPHAAAAAAGGDQLPAAGFPALPWGLQQQPAGHRGQQQQPHFSGRSSASRTAPHHKHRPPMMRVVAAGATTRSSSGSSMDAAAAALRGRLLLQALHDQQHQQHHHHLGPHDQHHQHQHPLLHPADCTASSAEGSWGEAMALEELLSLCSAVVQAHAPLRAAGVTPLQLAAVCLIESGGCPGAARHREQVGATAYGLGLVLPQTARWLAACKGFAAYSSTGGGADGADRLIRHGPCPSAAELARPAVGVYYGAAYLAALSRHGGRARSEAFVVRAFAAGPKRAGSQAAERYLLKYLKSKACLQQVAHAMAATLAAAGLAAGVPLACEAAGEDAEGAAAAAAAAGRPGNGGGECRQKKAVLPLASGARQDACIKDQDDADNHSSSRSTAITTASPPKAGSRPDAQQQQLVFVRAPAAELIATLTASWDTAGTAGSGKASSAGAAAAAGSAGGFLSSVLRFGVAARQAQHPARGRGSSSSSPRSCLELVPVTTAALQLAWERLAAVSLPAARAAVNQAAAAAAMAPHQSVGAAAASPPAAAAASGGALSAGSRLLRRLGSGGGSSAGDASSRSSPTPPPPTAPSHSRSGSGQQPQQAPPADSMPCLMHVVAPGETLASIAAVCRISVSDLLATNPELRGFCGSSGGGGVGGARGPFAAAATNSAAQEEEQPAVEVQGDDVIALPLAAVPPRLHVLQPGDSLAAVAHRHSVTVAALLASNPELLSDTSLVQPGWVVAVPGLRGHDGGGPAGLLASLERLAEEASAGTVEDGLPSDDAWPDSSRPDSWAGLQLGHLHSAAGEDDEGSLDTIAAGVQQQQQQWQRRRSSSSSGSTATARSSSCDGGGAQRRQQLLPAIGSGRLMFAVGDNADQWAASS